MTSGEQLQVVKRDILIPIIGTTGAGKSFFINALLRQQKMDVGRSLTSCTTKIDLEVNEGSELGGIIYLHDITTARFDGGSHQSLQSLRSLCGMRGRLDNVVLATTKWCHKDSYSEDLQTQLITTFESARGVIDPIMSFVVEQLQQNRPFRQNLDGLGVPHGPAVTSSTGARKFKTPFKKAIRPFVGLFNRQRNNAYF
ncbi:hypothetical protein CPB84DRAFT_1771128 [Gymnopilus junonius]|uniref:G domain-containing protein n=1 Tax=Gymnopilus junonius TaxID=109634 RepID=A0A9P5NVN6_GYMJU|nr:hypothetical protein CPB84DRAFT_1771128 [Gymnopilus junonius]